MRLWNPLNGCCLAELKGHYGLVTHIRFSEDSQQASLIWMLLSSSLALIHPFLALLIEFDLFQVASSCADKIFRVWDTKTHKEVKTFTVGDLCFTCCYHIIHMSKIDHTSFSNWPVMR